MAANFKTQKGIIIMHAKYYEEKNAAVFSTF